jgi:hypothetical protein
MPYSAVHRGVLYLADGFGPDIVVRDTLGNTIRTIHAPPAKSVSADAVWSSLEKQMRQRKKALNLEYLQKDRVPRQNRFPQIGGILIDDQDYLWVKAYDPYMDSDWLKTYAMWPAAGGEWRVFRADGSLVSTVQLPETLRPVEIRGNLLLGVSSNELGVERVVVHRIRR